eukprot:4211612-Amphidinium_carterae.2
MDAQAQCAHSTFTTSLYATNNESHVWGRMEVYGKSIQNIAAVTSAMVCVLLACCPKQCPDKCLFCGQLRYKDRSTLGRPTQRNHLNAQ